LGVGRALSAADPRFLPPMRQPDTVKAAGKCRFYLPG
jgi:hypothetical protein